MSEEQKSYYPRATIRDHDNCPPPTPPQVPPYDPSHHQEQPHQYDLPKAPESQPNQEDAGAPNNDYDELQKRLDALKKF